MPDIRVEGADRFGKLAKALRRVGDKELKRELYRGLARAVEPLAAGVRDSTRYFLPERYALELSKSLRVRPRTRAGRDPSIRLVGSAKTKQRKDRDLAALNRGRLRHPLYGNRRYWFNQGVTPNWWDDPLQGNAEVVRDEIEKVIDDIGRQLARKL